MNEMNQWPIRDGIKSANSYNTLVR